MSKQLKGWAVIDPKTGDWLCEVIIRRTPRDAKKLHTRPARQSNGELMRFPDVESVEEFLQDGVKHV